MVHLSIRAEQQLDGWSSADGVPVIDGPESKGPMSGIVAVANETQAALLVVACDLPLLTTETLEALIRARGAADCIAFKSSIDGLPEPLCAIYERSFTATLETALNAGQRCPRRILIDNPSRVHLLELRRPDALDNANSPEDLARISAQLKDYSR
jgi:molybdopterin-guanine dinucleotide biosynthesis protein A